LSRLPIGPKISYFTDMKKLLPLIGIITFFSIAQAARGDEEIKNCKLTIRTTFKSGKKKLDIEEVHAATREECKLIAKEREQIKDEEIEKIRATYGFR
jgi:hypothetical protein